MRAMGSDDLYGLALDRFIPERAALVKALRADRRRDEAARVAALRKPSIAAWAVNQLVRTQGDAVRELFAAGDGLRDAQADLLAGRGDGRALRAANQRERDAVDALVTAARGLLSGDGHELSPAVVERVADTLHAAALDAGARERAREGCLVRELRHAGLGLGESPGPAPAPAAARPEPRPATSAAPAEPVDPAARRPDAGPSRQAAAERRRAAREQAKRERAEREQAERERGEARQAARSAERAARRRAERAGHALKAAEERRARAAHALAEADEALEAAQVQAQDAVAAQRAAQAELERLA